MGLSSLSNINYVILLCRNIKYTRRFYRDVMQLTLVEDLDDWVRFQIGSGFLTLRPRGYWLKWHDGEAVEGAASVHLAFRVATHEVDQCHIELLERGVDIIEPPKDQFFRHRTMFFRDPEGNVLEIYAELD